MLAPDLAAQGGGIRVAPQEVKTIRSFRLADRLADRVREPGGHVLIGVNGQNPVVDDHHRTELTVAGRHRGRRGIHPYSKRESAFCPRIFASASAGSRSSVSRLSSRSQA